MRRGLVLTLLALAALAARGQDRGAPRPGPQEVAREVDALLEAAWREAKVEPAEPATDAAFLRRLSLDVEGVIPDERTVAAALARKLDRPTLVRALLHGQGFGRAMAQRWGNLLIGRRAVLESQGDGAARDLTLVAWLAQQVVANARWDAVVRDLLAPPERAGPPTGPALYRARYGGQVEEVTGNLLRTFQGLPLQCAQCHDHPFHEAWKQTDFWGVAAFLTDAREVRIPGTDRRVTPRFLGGEVPAEGADRRRELARLLTAPTNPSFARATVNRVWSFFFGRAFQDPDDLTQAPRLPRVLERLERDFVESGHDLRRLCEVVLSTRAYGLASTGPLATKDAQLAVFARARLRTLSPEQLWASLARAAGLDEGQDDAARARRAALRQEFWRVFGEAADGDPYTITQALSLLNGPATNAVSRPGEAPPPALTRLLASGSFDEQLGSLYLRVVGRPPTRGERQALRGPAALSSDEQVQLLGDLWWALLNSSEFVTNH